MDEIERARDLISSDRADEAVLLLRSATGLSENIVSFGLAIDAFVYKSIGVALGVVTTDSVDARIVDQVRESLWSQFSKRYKKWEGYKLRALSLHMSGVSIAETSKRLGLSPGMLQEMSAEGGYIAERKWVISQINEIVSDYVVPDVKVEHQLKPLVQKLGRKAMAGLNSEELSLKDSLKAYQELGKLLAQMTGELVERKQIELGPTEQFMRIMEAAENLSKEVIEVKEWKLIE